MTEQNVVHEINYGSVLLKIFETVSPTSGKVYYDYKSYRMYVNSEGEDSLATKLQQRDGLDNISAISDALKWISHQHRVRRGVVEG